MSESDARWPTTTPQARLTPVLEKVPVRDSLRTGIRLDEFEILRVLGTGGFGIVYLARDHVLQRDVAIKEYMPAVLARRGAGDTVSMRSTTGSCAETFARGLESFLSEARLLASFDHPALVKVHRFWRSHGTAYMAMPYYPGQTLKDVRLQMAGPPDEAWLDAFIQPLLGALELLHGEGVFHRDISPDNILMLPGGQPVLLDFGCARRVVADSSQWLTAHLKPQFAPLEQYAEEAGMRQGPWTDVYALGATLHFVLTGRAPTPSVVRAVRDVLPLLSSLAPQSLPGLPAHLLATIDWTLALAPEDRPQDVQTFRRALRGEIAPPRLPPRALPLAAGATDSANAGDAMPVEGTDAPATRGPASRRTLVGALSSLVVVGLACVGWMARSPAGADTATPPVDGVAAVSANASARVATGSPRPASMPMPVATPSGAHTAAAEPVALRMSTKAAPEYSLWDLPVVGSSPAATPAPARVAMSPTLSTAPDASGPKHERRKAQRVRPPSSRSPLTSVAQRQTNACSDPSGVVASVMCVVNPCRHSRGRPSAQCVDRQRAEQVRLSRMELR